MLLVGVPEISGSCVERVKLSPAMIFRKIIDDGLSFREFTPEKRLLCENDIDTNSMWARVGKRAIIYW